MKNKNLKKYLIILILLFALSLLTGCSSSKMTTIMNDSYGLRVCFVDCGQGDCAIIKLPNEKIMIIDSGENGQEEKIMSIIDSFNIKRIDYLIATHPHSDHIGGMSEIIDKYEIGEVYAPKITHSSKAFSDMVESLKKKDLKIKVAKRGRIIIDENNLVAEFISPNVEEEYEEYNNYSAVLSLKYFNDRILFCGDIEREVEREILDEGIDIKSNIIKIAHHGSNSSSSEDFLYEVNPKYAVISCGKDNPYGHPSDAVLSRLSDLNSKVYNTSRDGNVVFVIERSIECYSFK